MIVRQTAREDRPLSDRSMDITITARRSIGVKSKTQSQPNPFSWFLFIFCLLLHIKEFFSITSSMEIILIAKSSKLKSKYDPLLMKFSTNSIFLFTSFFFSSSFPMHYQPNPAKLGKRGIMVSSLWTHLLSLIIEPLKRRSISRNSNWELLTRVIFYLDFTGNIYGDIWSFLKKSVSESSIVTWLFKCIFDKVKHTRKQYIS